VTKTCCDCKTEKVLDEFHFLKRGRLERHARCKECHRNKQRERLRRIKAEVLAHYGGKCVCCGESAPQFLTIDHVNGGGRTHRKTMKASSIFEFLKKAGFPLEGYRVLCFNCNCARGLFGYCHKDSPLIPH